MYHTKIPDFPFSNPAHSIQPVILRGFLDEILQCHHMGTAPLNGWDGEWTTVARRF